MIFISIFVVNELNSYPNVFTALPVLGAFLIILYEKIIKSFENEKTKEFINLYFGNNAINTTEINYMLPIFI